MAFSTITSAVIRGLQVDMIHVETDISNGLPAFHMVGYLSSEVKEAAERVRTAIRNSNIQFPAKKVVVNLAPATVRKRGASFDLPIALSVLSSLGMIPGEKLKKTLVIGELSLDGRIQKVAGILPIVMEAKAQGIRTCIVPMENVEEGLLVEGMHIIGGINLEQICDCLTGDNPKKSRRRSKIVWNEEEEAREVDYADVHGQELVKRAAEIAVAGGHNLLLMGPPGSGKSMIARRIPTILPPLSKEESMEITRIYSVHGMVDEEQPLMRTRPFRSVHHTVTKAALIGGGSIPAPGEISLAHGGVLFLDELAEFQKQVLEVLRQPLEERQIRITRTHGNYVFPANFMLVAATNPCPCGNYPDLNKCNCTESQIRQYIGKISQPFLDRIDICVEAPMVQYEALIEARKRESSAQIRERVCAAREIQKHRYQEDGVRTNSMLTPQQVKQYCSLGQQEELLMRQAFHTLGLTARTYHKILKVARTIADLDGAEEIGLIHLREAIGYRTMDKKYWGR